MVLPFVQGVISGHRLQPAGSVRRLCNAPVAMGKAFVKLHKKLPRAWVDNSVCAACPAV